MLKPSVFFDFSFLIKICEIKEECELYPDDSLDLFTVGDICQKIHDKVYNKVAAKVKKDIEKYFSPAQFDRRGVDFSAGKIVAFTSSWNETYAREYNSLKFHLKSIVDTLGLKIKHSDNVYYRLNLGLEVDLDDIEGAYWQQLQDHRKDYYRFAKLELFAYGREDLPKFPKILVTRAKLSLINEINKIKPYGIIGQGYYMKLQQHRKRIEEFTCSDHVEELFKHSVADLDCEAKNVHGFFAGKYKPLEHLKKFGCTELITNSNKVTKL